MTESTISKYFPDQESGPEYLKHPKVILARKLLREASVELRSQRKEIEFEQKCKCGHRRYDHGPSYSINYTDGVCMIKKCECLNFLQSR